MALRSELGAAQQGNPRKLVKVQSPLAECIEAPSSPSCAHIFKELKDPYYLGDEAGLTQSLGWGVDAWTSRPSAYLIFASIDHTFRGRKDQVIQDQAALELD